MDIYIYCFDNEIYKKFTPLSKHCKINQLHCYHSSPIPGVLTENIFYKIFSDDFSSRMISHDIPNDTPVLAVAVDPNDQSYKKSLENFILMNLHNINHIKNVFGENVVDIFDHSKIKWGYKNIKELLKTQTSLFRVQENYNNLISQKTNFPIISLRKNEIDEFVAQFNMKKYISQCIPFQSKIPSQIYTNYSLDYLCYATIGMGDFIQRFERLYKLLNFSDITFIPIKNEKYSYNNCNHGQDKYLRMIDFPGFDFIHEKSVDSRNLVNIGFQNLLELMMYNKNFFGEFKNNDSIIYVNLGSYIQNINNRPILKDAFGWKNSEKLIKNINVPYTQHNWKLPWTKTNKLIIIHFRRGDYVTQYIQHAKNKRTMSTFKHILNELNVNEKNMDAIILSDHYDYSNIPTNMKKYIPVLFDYSCIEKYSDISFGNNQTLHIKDVVLGEDGQSNLKSLQYISNCDYHIGNMSCFPTIMGKIFNKNKINHLQVKPNIKNWEDVETLLTAESFYQ